MVCPVAILGLCLTRSLPACGVTMVASTERPPRMAVINTPPTVAQVPMRATQMAAGNLVVGRDGKAIAWLYAL